MYSIFFLFDSENDALDHIRVDRNILWTVGKSIHVLNKYS